MAAQLRWFKSRFPGFKDVLVGLLVGAGLTKVYYETNSDSRKGKDYTKRQIRQIVQKHESLKFGERLRTIDLRNGSDINTEHLMSVDSVSKYGLPQRSTEFMEYTNHALCYDQARKIPRWAAEHLTRDKVTMGKAERVHASFQPDLNVPAEFQSNNDDYLGSGWSRGHMAPAGDNKFNQDAMNETFFLSNVVPQDFDNNGNFWYRLETYCRSLTKRYSDVYVISGPLFLPTSENGKNVVKYEVIGDGNVAVPTHLFKVILAESESKSSVLGAFIVPNKPIGFENKLQDFQVPLEQLVKDSGLMFFPNFQVSKAEDLCDVDGCRLISKQFMELIIFSRKLRGCRTLEELNQVWSSAGNITPDKIVTESYEKKKEELRAAEITEIDNKTDEKEKRLLPPVITEQHLTSGEISQDMDQDLFSRPRS